MNVDENGKNVGGRPTKYKPEYDEQVYKLCLLGMTDVELANYFEVTEQTLNAWKHEYPSFLESIRDGKENADAEVSKSLYKRALGYAHEDVHISNFQGQITETPLVKHYPPDTAAAIFWLKNRRRKTGVTWSDKVETELSGPGGTPLIDTVLNAEVARSIAFLLANAAATKETT